MRVCNIGHRSVRASVFASCDYSEFVLVLLSHDVPPGERR